MTTELLTSAEHKFLGTIADAYNLLCVIMGTDDTAQGDMEEALFHIHALQRMVGSQAAGRAYPKLYRRLGERVEFATASDQA